MTKPAVILVAHGTVDALDDLPAFVANIRRGHPPPPGLIEELRRRYEVIGGQSPLNAITRDVARALEARLGVPVRTAMRLWRPYPKEVLADLAREGVGRVVAVPLAQHSAHVYAEAMREAASALAGEGIAIEVACADNWGRTPALTRAYADALAAALERVPRDAWSRTTTLLTAHSLPLFVVRGGDPYETEVRASADAIVADLRARGIDVPRPIVAFQSQGATTGPGGKPVEWLGPDLKAALDDAQRRGDAHVVVAPIGFLADHVEILYDLDVEAAAMAKERGLGFVRAASLNASRGIVDALVDVAAPLLAASAER